MAADVEERRHEESIIVEISAKGPPGREWGRSLETVLIVGAIALPILIFLIKVGWPTVKSYFNQGMTDLQGSAAQAEQ